MSEAMEVLNRKRIAEHFVVDDNVVSLLEASDQEPKKDNHVTVEAADLMENEEIIRHKVAMHTMRKMRRSIRFRTEAAAYTLLQTGMPQTPGELQRALPCHCCGNQVCKYMISGDVVKQPMYACSCGCVALHNGIVTCNNLTSNHKSVSPATWRQNCVQKHGETSHSQSIWLENVHRTLKAWAVDGVVVELCCGTKSVGAVFEHLGVPTVSIDYDPRWDPDLLLDIAQTPTNALHLSIMQEIKAKYGQALKIICFWASPQCTEYSRANTTPKHGKRDLIRADRLVQACMDIFLTEPTVSWFLENPATGLLKHRPLMRGIMFRVVDYCKYSAATNPCCVAQHCPICNFRCKYKKETAIWTNTNWKPRHGLCRKGSRCEFAHDGVHKETAGGANSGSHAYPVPGRLVNEIAEYVLQSLD